MAIPTALRLLHSRYQSTECILLTLSQFETLPRSTSRGKRNTPKYHYSYYRETLEGKTGLAYFPLSPEKRGRTDITRGLWNFAYWETTRDSADYDKWPGQFLRFSKATDRFPDTAVVVAARIPHGVRIPQVHCWKRVRRCQPFDT